MKTRTLKYKAGRWGAPYYRDPVTNNGIICVKGLRRYISLPVDCETIRVVTTTVEPANNEYFDIRPSGLLVGVRIELTSEFQMWLQIRYTYGARYMYFDYKE